jgi:signal transduction histidine kinase
MHIQLTQFLRLTVFVVAYVAIDRATYMHPLHGLNITPWNPPPAIALALWLHFGKVVAIPWFIAIVVAETLIRAMPVSMGFTLALSAGMVIGYGAIGEMMRRSIGKAELFGVQRQLLIWVVIVAIGTLLTSFFYVSMVYNAGLIPYDEWLLAMMRFWMGDCVGIVVTMPFCWMLFDSNGRKRLLAAFSRWETAGYATLGVTVLWVAFGLGNGGEFKYFYLLFLPIVWAAARQGVAGAAIAAFVLPTGIIIAALWTELVAVSVFELQMLGAVLAFVGFFIGIVVDERQRVNMELQQTLRLAAAGEMAAALAHELNQPLSALSAYGAASEHLLSQGDTGAQLRDTIQRMVAESRRAADVVRRLRDFFRTGATRLEKVSLAELIEAATFSFSAKAMRNGIDLKIQPFPDCILLIDRLQIEVVLRNLLSNAFDAISDRPQTQRHIEISAHRSKAGHVSIRVEDSGSGVSAAMAERFFEAFRSTKTSGLGLGLPISRAIVEAHGGTLKAEAADYGVFVILLPVEEEGNDVQ